MKSQKLSRVMFGLGAALCLGQLTGPLAMAQSSSPRTPETSFQRSEEIYHFSTAATSGPQRGEEIYYYKCWMCHNDYTIAAGTPAPTLAGIYERSTLVSDVIGAIKPLVLQEKLSMRNLDLTWTN